MQLKNNDSIAHVWGGLSLNASATADIDRLWSMSLSGDSQFLSDLAANKAQVLDGATVLNLSDAIGYISGTNVKADIVKTTPFAEPTYRTCRDKTPDLETLEQGEIKTIDFQITAERYLNGGSIVYKNAQIGDWISAEVYDKDGVIPAPYRAALCEAWPMVAKYIIGQWVNPGEGAIEVNTYPLNAKLSAGLYLRVTYYAAGAGLLSRSVGVNYFLTKKL